MSYCPQCGHKVRAAAPAKKAMTLAQLPAGERAVAERFKKQGYTVGIQFIDEDGTDWGEPIYFKVGRDVGPFMRDNPTLKMGWMVKM